MNSSKPVIIHIDMDAFFASVEQQANPELRGKPVIVCGDSGDRGVVAAASYEARRFGVRSAMPIREAKRLCPRVILVKGRHSYYGEISKRLLELYRNYTPSVEPFSIDEAFLNVAGCERLYGSPENIAYMIKAKVKNCFGLTCSAGIAPNKFLAKMASNMNKPDGLTIIQSDNIKTTIWPLPIGRLYGVGEKTARVLKSLGINTIGEMAEMPIELFIEKLGETGRVLHNLACGIDNSPVDPNIWDIPKSIGHETTLREDSLNIDTILIHILSLSQQVGRRLRQQGLLGRTIMIKLRYSNFATLTRANTFPHFTCLDEDIYETAKNLFISAWDHLRKIRLIGVTVTNLSAKDDFMRQLALFEKDKRRERVTAAIDNLRNKFGENAVTRASLIKPGTKSKGGGVIES